MKKFQLLMEKFVDPLAKKLNESKIVKALSMGLMATIPITIGVAAICVLTALPIPGWTEFLESTGLKQMGLEVTQATLSMLAIYMVFSISYSYGKNDNENGLTVGLISVASFLILIPQFISVEGGSITALESRFLGSDGMFVGMLVAIITAILYCKLIKLNIKLSFPDTVPNMVSDSLSPIFVSMILLTLMSVVKYICFITPYGNIFEIINAFIGAPIMKLGASPISFIALFTFTSFMWFFGVHPSPITSVFTPVIIIVMTANVQAYLMGEALPYLECAIVFMCLKMSGTGNTLGLSLLMTRAKSQRYRTMSGICLIPNLFNINEPVIFGMPCVLNPLMTLPMILATLLPGLIGLVASHFITFSLNPTISMPWVTPTFITAFMQGGWQLLLLICFCFVITTVVYYPFFKIADNKAYEEEKLGQLEVKED